MMTDQGTSPKKELTETENRFYLVMSLIFEKIMDSEPSYQLGLYQWQKTRPEILQSIGLSDEFWTEISDFGDQDEKLQERLAALREKYENYSRELLLSNIANILKAL